ncbi:hypothetical protein EOM86_12445 [Candidatus Nomurabacteria bacterium]|nr:hypothetical protein [Candidatus Nomurabacteria bacterium]
MKKIKNVSFEIDGDFWIGDKVFALTSYGLPVRVDVDRADVILDGNGKGIILGYFYTNYKFCPDNLMSQAECKSQYPNILDIPDFPDYVKYELSKALKKNKKFLDLYEKAYILPYKDDIKKCD